MSDWFHVSELEPGVTIVAEPGHVACWLVQGSRPRGPDRHRPRGRRRGRGDPARGARARLRRQLPQPLRPRRRQRALRGLLDSPTGRPAACRRRARRSPRGATRRARASSRSAGTSSTPPTGRGSTSSGPTRRAALAATRLRRRLLEDRARRAGAAPRGRRRPRARRPLAPRHPHAGPRTRPHLPARRACGDPVRAGPGVLRAAPGVRRGLDVVAWARSRRRLADEGRPAFREVYAAHCLRPAVPPRQLRSLRTPARRSRAGRGAARRQRLLGAVVSVADFGHFSILLPPGP